MDWSAIVQLGALGVIAVLMIVKDGKRDDFFQSFLTEMRKTVDSNTAAINELRSELKEMRKK